MQISILTLIALMGIPSAITGFCFWALQRNIAKKEKKREEKEKIREENLYLVMKGVKASISLGEETAQSVRRLDPGCNGEMTAALEFAKKVKSDQNEFLQRQASKF